MECAIICAQFASNLVNTCGLDKFGHGVMVSLILEMYDETYPPVIKHGNGKCPDIWVDYNHALTLIVQA